MKKITKTAQQQSRRKIALALTLKQLNTLKNLNNNDSDYVQYIKSKYENNPKGIDKLIKLKEQTIEILNGRIN